MATVTRIAHISDIHFGKIAHRSAGSSEAGFPAIVQALIDDVNSAGVDLVVASGDLTQRAFGHQFRAARQMLDAFDAPTLVVPGNHDVFPWWRFFSRLFDPLRRYRKIITPDLAPFVRLEGVAVKGINSAFGWTIQGGRITPAELDEIRTGYDAAEASDVRILVVHHHLAELQEIGRHDMAKGASKAFAAAHAAGVGLILSGHLHVSHVAHVSVHPGKHPIVIASSGTSTSSRGRGKDKATNYYNLVDVAAGSLRITERKHDPVAARFVESGHKEFDLN